MQHSHPLQIDSVLSSASQLQSGQSLQVVHSLVAECMLKRASQMKQVPTLTRMSF